MIIFLSALLEWRRSREPKTDLSSLREMKPLPSWVSGSYEVEVSEAGLQVFLAVASLELCARGDELCVRREEYRRSRPDRSR